MHTDTQCQGIHNHNNTSLFLVEKVRRIIVKITTVLIVTTKMMVMIIIVPNDMSFQELSKEMPLRTVPTNKRHFFLGV